jgi:hypothetical protein
MILLVFIGYLFLAKLPGNNTPVPNDRKSVQFERRLAQDQVFVSRSFVLSAQRVIFAKGNLNVAIHGPGVPRAFFDPSLRNFRPPGTGIGAPANMGNDERFGIPRLFQTRAQQHRVHASVDSYDPAILYPDPNRLRHIPPEHDEYVSHLQYQRTLGRLFLRRAKQKP